MGLWKPAADPGTVSQAGSLSGQLVSGLSGEGPKLATLVPTGWSGQAAGAAAGQAGKLGQLVKDFCDKTNQASTAMKAFAQDYANFKAKFDKLDADHTAAQQRVASLNRSIESYQGKTLTVDDRSDLSRLTTQRDQAQGEIAQLEKQHDQTMTDFKASQQRAAGQLDAATPQGLTGTPSQQAAQVTAMVYKEMPSVQEEEGRRLGQKIKDDLAKTGRASQAEIDQLSANANNPDFVKGAYGALGPSGVAALSLQAKHDLQSPYDKDHPGGQKLFDALHTSFGVAAKQGLITDDWLNHFDPNPALPKELQRHDTNGFRADLLIPLAAGQKLPTNLMQSIGDKAFGDLKNGMEGGAPQVLDKWGAYVGDDSKKDAYSKNLMREFLGDLSNDPEASNGTLMKNFDTLQKIGRGGLPDEVNKQIGGNLDKTVDAGVLGIGDLDHDGHRDTGPGSKGFLGDALMSRLVLDTADHKDAHYADFYRHELGSLVTNQRYFDDAMYSVTAIPPGGMPSTGADWINADSRPYRDGIELDSSAWAAMHQEVMADPGTASKLIDETRTAMANATAHGESLVPPGGHGADPTLGYTDSIARNQMHQFLIGNLDGAHDRLQSELNQITGNEATAKGAVTKIIGWASDPNSIVKDLKGASIDKGTDWLVHQAYAPAEQDVSKAMAGLDHTREQLQADKLNSSPNVYFDSANGLTQRPDQIEHVQVTQPDGHVVTYTGDPHQYIDKYSSTEYGEYGPVKHDGNFLGSDGRPLPVDQIEADPDKLRAYEEWLHDPAVQHQAQKAASQSLGLAGK
jgi:hypothetical protein